MGWNHYVSSVEVEGCKTCFTHVALNQEIRLRTNLLGGKEKILGLLWVIARVAAHCDVHFCWTPKSFP